MSARSRIWINLLGFQLCWLLLVGGAGRQWIVPGLAAAFVFSITHFLLHPKHWREVGLALITMIIGAAFDALLMKQGVVRFASPSRFAGWSPEWMMALWWIFALTLNHSMRFFQDKPWLCRLFGFFGGAASYYFAARTWNAAEFLLPLGKSLLAIGAGWALIFSFLMWLAPKFDSNKELANA